MQYRAIFGYWLSQAVNTKVATRTCSLKKVFLKVSENSHENTCAGVSFL